jgi:hypothetical protein
MRNSLSMRAARACPAGTLLLSLALPPAIAHMPASRTGIGPGHVAPLGFRSFNRIGVNRFRYNRFGFDRFDNHRFGFNRFGGNVNAFDSGLLGLDGWGYWGYPPSSPTAPAAPIIVGAGGPPVVINAYSGVAADPGEHGGGCVIHQLQYDSAGSYVGERQIPGC